MKEKVPHIETDEQAEIFLANDLSSLDFLQFSAAKFEVDNKSDQIDIRVSKQLLDR